MTWIDVRYQGNVVDSWTYSIVVNYRAQTMSDCKNGAFREFPKRASEDGTVPAIQYHLLSYCLPDQLIRGVVNACGSLPE